MKLRMSALLIALLACAGALPLCAAGAGVKPPEPVRLLKLEPGVQREGRLRFHAATMDSQSLRMAAGSLPDSESIQL